MGRGWLALGGIGVAGCSLLFPVDEFQSGAADSGTGAETSTDGGSEGGAPLDLEHFHDALALRVVSGLTCALRANGTVVCWGDGSHGQLGIATESSTTPVGVPVLSAIVGIALGSHHACALDAIGGVWCWGSNAFGELGLGVSDGDLHPTPTKIGALVGATCIAAGFFTSCACAEGKASCWGNNDYLQAGVPSASATPPPVLSPVDVQGVANPSQIAVGGASSCARGAAMGCWGTNNLGQLGTSSPPDRTSSPVMPTVPGGTMVIEVAAGEEHTCILESTGNVRCWGGNNTNGERGDVAGPAVLLVPGWDQGNIVALGAGGRNTCAVHADGRVSCLGSNDRGQLGNGAVAASGVAHKTPSMVQDIAFATAVVVGPTHACALVRGDDRRRNVQCWGSNDVGQLGDGTKEARLRPVPVSLPR